MSRFAAPSYCCWNRANGCVNGLSLIVSRLQVANPSLFTLYCASAAFGTYFCMYAFRKPFSAGTFEVYVAMGIGIKMIYVASQVFGYTLSKFIGIKWVSEMTPPRHAGSILGLIAVAPVTLMLFAITPVPYNAIWLFVKGLPLGMVFGLVMGFLEGRKLTEAMIAGLCARFIFASGAMKSTGTWLITDMAVSEFSMP